MVYFFGKAWFGLLLYGARANTGRVDAAATAWRVIRSRSDLDKSADDPARSRGVDAKTPQVLPRAAALPGAPAVHGPGGRGRGVV